MVSSNSFMTLDSKATSVVLQGEILANGSRTVAKERVRVCQVWILCNNVMKEVVQSFLVTLIVRKADSNV